MNTAYQWIVDNNIPLHPFTYTGAQKLDAISGIYAIVCMSNHRVYIGRSVNIVKRVSSHLANLSNKKHCNVIMQNTWDKYGSDNLRLCVLELVVSEELLCKMETLYILSLKPEMNIRNMGDGFNGKPVDVHDRSGVFLATYSSRESASIALGVSAQAITLNTTGKQYYTRRFIFTDHGVGVKPESLVKQGGPKKTDCENERSRRDT